MQPQQQEQPDAYQQVPQPPQQPAPTDWQQPAAPVAADASMPVQIPQPEQPAPAPINPAPAPPPPPVPPSAPVDTSQPIPSEQPVQMQYSDNSANEPQQQAEFAPDGSQPDMNPEQNFGGEELVRWQASEHIHRQKTAVWYGTFAVVVVGLIAVAIFIVNSVTFAILIPVMAIALAVYATHPPMLIDYTLSRKGLHVNDRLYDFDSFKEFGLIRDDDENSILLVPRKRFQPGLTIYFPDEAGEAIVDMLAARLPMHEVRLDPIDRLIRRLHI